MYSLEVVQISKVQANQRAGRAGRTRPGKCYRLYPSVAYHEELLDATIPEIQRSSLAGSVLYLKSLDLPDIDILTFDFLDSPSSESLRDALNPLYLIDAIDENGLITRVGKTMAGFGEKIWFWLGAIVTTSHIKFLMIHKSVCIARMMGCCSCFGFSIARKPKPKRKPSYSYSNHPSQEHLLDDDLEDDDDCSYNDDATSMGNAEESEQQSRAKRPDEILSFREQNGMICRQYPVKETHKVVRTEDDDGNKMVNEYVRECKIGSGSYGKVVLYRSLVDGKHYALKAFHKSHLLKLRVAPSETAKFCLEP